jgi:predicted dehydrogenase
MGTYKLAVLGLNQGAKAARDSLSNPDFDLVAVGGFGDQAEAVAAELSETKGVEVPLFSDYKDLFNEVELDAVVIALPNFLHWPATEAALAAGIRNILVEKPIADTVEDANKIIAACKEACAHLLVGHQRRSSAIMLKTREIIASGELGKVVALDCSATYAKPDSYYVGWHTTTGPLLINAIHDVDDFHYLLDSKCVSVYCDAGNPIRGGEIEDVVVATLRYENGVRVSYFLSDGVPSPWGYDMDAQEMHFMDCYAGENHLHVLGTKGSLGVPNMDVFHYLPDHEGWTEPLQRKHYPLDRPDPATATLAHFGDLCAGRVEKSRCSGESALETLKVVQALMESAATGKIVTLN